MACIGCENYAKRVSNVYRDEEIKDQFESIIGYEITSDSFICDDCLIKLNDVISFRNQCRKIHEKNHPNVKIRLTEIPSENIIVEEQNLMETIDDPLDQTSQETFTIIEHSPKRKTVRGKKLKSEGSATKIIQTTDDVQETSMIIYGSNDENEMLFEIQNDSQLDDSKTKVPRKTWTVAQKLDIIAYAEEHSNREAARHFQLNESSVRCFRRQKDQLQTMQPNKSTNRHGVAYWPELEDTLKKWVNSQKTKPKIHQIQKEACDLAKKMGYTNFSGSTSYIFKFMQRNGINSSSPRPRKNLKSDLDETME